MANEIITQTQKECRRYWIDEISVVTDSFGINTDKIAKEVSGEVEEEGLTSLLGHLRLCGAIPEKYGHDSSEEKLYSKYTDIVINEAFKFIELNSVVLTERADAADVECVSEDYCFVADAKAFRLSRTAKNQKDFKVQAMHGWKYGKPFAMVVCPVYQLPTRTSQIYQQAARSSVWVATYTHLAVLVRYAEATSAGKARELLHEVFKTVEALNPTKEAYSYWQPINRRMLEFDGLIAEIWTEEKIASVESISISRAEALQFLAEERERIMKLSHKDAINEILKSSKIDSKIKAINSVAANNILCVK